MTMNDSIFFIIKEVDKKFASHALFSYSGEDWMSTSSGIIEKNGEMPSKNILVIYGFMRLDFQFKYRFPAGIPCPSSINDLTNLLDYLVKKTDSLNIYTSYNWEKSVTSIYNAKTGTCDVCDHDGDDDELNSDAHKEMTEKIQAYDKFAMRWKISASLMLHKDMKNMANPWHFQQFIEMSDEAFDGVVHIVNPISLSSEIKNKHMAAANTIHDDQKAIKEQIYVLQATLRDKEIQEKNERSLASSKAAIEFEDAMKKVTRDYVDVPKEYNNYNNTKVYARLK